MESSPFHFPESYQDNLRKINDIKFTLREVEIIAFIVHGRSGKKIASFFSISPRTVENHIRNIMEKLQCNSREGIIDFIEKSGKFLCIKRYYLSLLIHTEFETTLRYIALSNGEAACSIVRWQDAGDEYAFLPYLKAHLKFAGVKTSYDNRQQQQSLCHLLKESSQSAYRVYLLPRSILEEFEVSDHDVEGLSLSQLDYQKTCSKLFIFPTEKHAEEILRGALSEGIRFDSIDLDTHKNYYSLVFEILKRLFSKQPIEGMALAFHNKMATLANFPDPEKKSFEPPGTYLAPKKTDAKSGTRKLPVSWGTCVPLMLMWLLVCLGLSGLWFQSSHDQDKWLYFFPRQNQWQALSPKLSIRSNLVIPVKSVLLDRPELLSWIEERFKKYPAGIQTVALAGIGGSGKTTLARQYAHLQKIPVIWEINAETRETLLNSFESLAYALSKTEKERKAVKGLQDIKNRIEKEDKIIQWVNNHLKASKSWLLIYDNVISFENIRKYFPSTRNAWGSGQVIMTTRNSHMENNNFVDHTLPIKELDADQKLSLFNKIFLNHPGQSFPTSAKIKKTKNFLKEIPSFPLDVSVAAYYLKTTNVSYEKYLDYLKVHNKEFENIQNYVLKEVSEYNETRYGIITLSLKEIIESHQDFKELLLLISLLDSQDIPRDLLSTHKNDLIVDKFIYSLKKYSLVSTQTSRSIPSLMTFAIHRSTQAISLLYLTKKFNLVNEQESISKIANSLTDYIGNVIEAENIEMMKILIPHCEAFRNHHKSFLIPRNLTGTLGCMYLYLGNYLEAKKLLLTSINGLNPEEKEKSLWSIRALTYLGAAHVSLGNYEAAKSVLRQSIKGYQNYFPKSYAGYAQALRYLATAYRDTGDYETAKKLFEESLGIYQNRLPHLYVGMGRALGYVGDIYRESGIFIESWVNLKKQELSLSKALTFMQNIFLKTHSVFSGTLPR